MYLSWYGLEYTIGHISSAFLNAGLVSMIYFCKNIDMLMYLETKCKWFLCNVNNMDGTDE